MNKIIAVIIVLFLSFIPNIFAAESCGTPPPASSPDGDNPGKAQGGFYAIAVEAFDANGNKIGTSA